MTDSLSSRVRVLLREGKLDEARSLVTEYLGEANLKLAPVDPSIIGASNQLILSSYTAGRPAEALPLADELLKAVRAQPNSNSPEALNAIHTVALVYEATGRFDQAVPLFEETVAGRKAARGPNDPNTLSEMQGLSLAYQKAGRLGDSQRLLEETVNLYKTNGISEIPDAGVAQARLGLTLICEGKFDEAEPLLRNALAIFAKFPDPFWTSYIQSLLGEALVGQKKYADAEPLLLQGYRGMKENENQIGGNRAGALTDAAQRLVTLYTDRGKPDSAAQWSATVDSIRKAAPTTTAPSN